MQALGVSEAFANSVALAQRAEARGYRRVWYAEHHNMASIASSATSVLIAHVAAHTTSIRLGAGGVMLPNHSPLTIAEQFGFEQHLFEQFIYAGAVFSRNVVALEFTSPFLNEVVHFG